MIRDDSSTAFWRPSYPIGRDEEVSFADCELQTFISDRRPGITVMDYPLESPACFWIDSSHVYLRVNWGQWCTVSLSSPNHVTALCAARYCRITHSQNNEIRECLAPVFHIKELPRELFKSEFGNESREQGNETSKKQISISKLQTRILPDMEAMAFTHVAIESELLDFVLSSDDVAFVFDVYPEDEDYAAAPIGDEDAASDLNATVISAKRLDKLMKQVNALKEIADGAVVHAAIIASENTLESMRNAWKDKLDEMNVFLVDYRDFEDFQRWHFTPMVAIGGYGESD